MYILLDERFSAAQHLQMLGFFFTQDVYITLALLVGNCMFTYNADLFLNYTKKYLL